MNPNLNYDELEHDVATCFWCRNDCCISQIKNELFEFSQKLKNKKQIEEKINEQA